MTRAERLRAFEMRLDGASWSAISAEIHYAPDTIRDDLAACIRARPHQIQCCYPAIRQVIAQRYGSVRAFAMQSGIPYNTLYYLFSGRAVRPDRKTVDAILLATGLTDEEAFRKEE